MRVQTRVAPLLAIIAFGLLAQTSDQASGQSVDPNVATLKQRLVSGLRARKPSEKAFLNKLATEVTQKTVPKQLVDNTFFYVQSRYRKHNFPFIYFEKILRIRAKKLNVVIPPYTYPST